MTRRKTLVLVTLIAVATAGGVWGAIRAARAQTDGGVRFAQSMPAGALVYLEARDLGGLLNTWIASPMRDRYFSSESYRSFTRSRLYLKLQDRLGDLQRGFGVDITDERLAELAGGPSAIAIYDPGKLEVLVVTEVPRERALASSVFANAKDFEQRKTAKGNDFYAREVVTDGGNLVQRIAFGYVDGRLWIGTSEALVAAAIDGPEGGGLQPAVAETLKSARGFSAHDMVVWFDLERTLRNKYFNLYWIQRNAKDLEGMSSGIIDLEFAGTGVKERRWFVLRDPSKAPAATDAAALSKIGAMAPDGSQLLEVKAADAGLPGAVAETVFGPERSGSSLASVNASSGSDPFAADSNTESYTQPASGRYRYLDSRFDRDVDDPAFAAAAKPASDTASEQPFAARLGALVAAGSPVRYGVFGSIEMPKTALFASFERAVVVELGAPDRFDAAQFEALVRSEFGRRFIVGGDVTRVSWTDTNGARSLAGALVSQGGAYRRVGPYLIVANDAATCAAIAARAGTAGGESVDGQVTRLAEVRIDAARDPYVRLTKVLDSGQISELEQDVSTGDDGDEDNSNRSVLFFSENIASLLDVARDLTAVRIVTSIDGNVLREQVDYVFRATVAEEKEPQMNTGEHRSDL